MESSGDDGMNLSLDPTTHTYSLDDGRKLISVTQALSILDNRCRIDPFYLERGRLIHLATEYYDRDELDESSLDSRIAPYVESYIKFRMNTDFEPKLIEQKFYHPQYFYAGRLDRQGPLNGISVIIDIKSGAKADVDELQEVALWELCRVNNIPVTKLFDLYLRDNGGMPNLVPIKKPKKLLLPVFLAALTCERWRQGI